MSEPIQQHAGSTIGAESPAFKTIVPEDKGPDVGTYSAASREYHRGREHSIQDQSSRGPKGWDGWVWSRIIESQREWKRRPTGTAFAYKTKVTFGGMRKNRYICVMKVIRFIILAIVALIPVAGRAATPEEVAQSAMEGYA